VPWITLELPEPVHHALTQLSERRGISVSEFLSAEVGEMLAQHEYLDARAKRSTRESFERVLAQVPDVPPDPGDER